MVDHSESKPARARKPRAATVRAKPEPTKPDLGEVIKRGDRRAALEALRDTLVDSLMAAQPNVVAQIAGRLQAVMAEIATLPVEKKVTKADELAGRRKARRAAAQAVASAAGEGK